MVISAKHLFSTDDLIDATEACEMIDAARCLQCGRLVVDHRTWTEADVAATAGAAYKNPVTLPENCGMTVVVRTPISPKCVGQFIGHDPMK